MGQEPLGAVYQEILLQRSRQPTGEGILAEADFFEQGDNPLCGDRVEISGCYEGEEEVLKELVFEAQACAIVRASADVMVSELKGKTRAQAQAKIAEVLGKLAQPQELELDGEAEGDLTAVYGVRQFPARLKCASLAWETLAKALDR